jgi:hypothetical protein
MEDRSEARDWERGGYGNWRFFVFFGLDYRGHGIGVEDDACGGEAGGRRIVASYSGLGRAEAVWGVRTWYLFANQS